MPDLPSFLRPCLSRLPAHETLALGYIHTTYDHKALGPSHAIWWPAKHDAKPDVVLLFIPGNPGLADFYIPFLGAIHAQLQSNATVIAHGLLGHVPAIDNTRIGYSSEDSLRVQVTGTVELLKSIKDYYGNDIKTILISHSIGTWISLQVLKLCPDDISASFMLCPTLSNLVKTPNGRVLQYIFRPYARKFISSVAPLATSLPVWLYHRLFPTWPVDQLNVLRQFVGNSDTVLASLSMAHEEMGLGEPDFEALKRYKYKLWYYYAVPDSWVGDERIKILQNVDVDGTSVQVCHGPSGVPHAFCINHSTLVASTCVDWLRQLDIQ